MKRCIDCDSDFENRWKSAKRCEVCRMKNSVIWIKTQTTKCLICKKKFNPRKRGDQFCGECEVEHRHPPKSLMGKCGICKTDDVLLLSENIKCCTVCSTSKDKREKLIRALVKKQSFLKENPIRLKESNDLHSTSQSATLPE